MALGHARGAFERSLEYCRTNNLGRKRLIDYREVQMELADMIVSLWTVRSTIWHSVSSFRCYQSLSSAAKVFASDTAFKVTNQAMELMGDAGYIQSYGVERAMRDSRLAQIYEGTNQMNRLAIMEHQWDIEFEKGAINL
jgi:alkylation response protein AidB-like acyl-CoA dehydrogenase